MGVLPFDALGSRPLWKIQRLLWRILWDIFKTLAFSVWESKTVLPGPCWTLKIEYDGSIVTYILTLVILYYESSQARWIVLISSLIFTIWTHDWMGHFVAGLILAHMDHQKIFKSVALSKWKSLLHTFLCLILAVFFLHSPLTLGSNTSEWIRTLQINDEGKYGVGDPFWEENASMLMVCFIIETNLTVQKIFAWKGFIFLGKISFVMYLFHPMIIEVFSQPLTH
jgi:peptidoglycan/LPS O-acetylase OafA/YrhL